MSKNKFEGWEFGVYETRWCCGIEEVGGFRLESGEYYDWDAGRIVNSRKFKTKEEAAEDCYKRIVEYTTCPQLLISLVSCYSKGSVKEGQHQFPELQDILLREGWTIYSVFINPNHGNEVTLFGKVFPERTEIKNPDDIWHPENDDVDEEDEVY